MQSSSSFPYKGFEITITDENGDGTYGYVVHKDGEDRIFMSEYFNSFDEAKKAAKKHVTRGLVFMEGRSARMKRNSSAQWRRHRSLGQDVWDLIVDSGGSSYRKGRVVLTSGGWKAIVMHDNSGELMATIDGLPSIEKAQEWVSDISGIRVSRSATVSQIKEAVGYMSGYSWISPNGASKIQKLVNGNDERGMIDQDKEGRWHAFADDYYGKELGYKVFDTEDEAKHYVESFLDGYVRNSKSSATVSHIKEAVSRRTSAHEWVQEGFVSEGGQDYWVLDIASSDTNDTFAFVADNGGSFYWEAIDDSQVLASGYEPSLKAATLAAEKALAEGTGLPMAVRSSGRRRASRRDRKTSRRAMRRRGYEERFSDGSVLIYEGFEGEFELNTFNDGGLWSWSVIDNKLPYMQNEIGSGKGFSSPEDAEDALWAFYNEFRRNPRYTMRHKRSSEGRTTTVERRNKLSWDAKQHAADWFESYFTDGFVLANDFGEWASRVLDDDFEYSYKTVVGMFEDDALGGVRVEDWIDAFFETRDDYGEWDYTRAPKPRTSRRSRKASEWRIAAEDFGPIASLWNGRAKAAYRRGWRASQNDWGSTLEKADLDGRADCDYWYSGYMDSSTGRDMWELVADDGSMYVKDGHTCSYCKA